MGLCTFAFVLSFLPCLHTFLVCHPYIFFTFLKFYFLYIHASIILMAKFAFSCAVTECYQVMAAPNMALILAWSHDV